MILKNIETPNYPIYVWDSTIQLQGALLIVNDPQCVVKHVKKVGAIVESTQLVNTGNYGVFLIHLRIMPHHHLHLKPTARSAGYKPPLNQ